MKKLTSIQKSILIIITILIVGLYYGYGIYSEKKYVENSKIATAKMVEIVTISEFTTNVYSSIWRQAIYNRYADYTSPYYAMDFSAAIQKCQQSKEVVTALKEIDNRVVTLEKTIKNMNNPPSKYKDSHLDMVELYLATKEFAKLANNPEGSLQSFNQRTSELTSKISSLVEKIKLNQ